MKKPPRKRTAARADASFAKTSTAFKISLRGKDNAPLSIQELTQGLYEAAQRLKPHGGKCRVKRATLYLVIVDENGEEVRINAKNELTIYPYRSIADELGI